MGEGVARWERCRVSSDEVDAVEDVAPLVGSAGLEVQFSCS